MSSHNFIISDAALIALSAGKNGPALTQPQGTSGRSGVAMEMKTPRFQVVFVESPRPRPSRDR